LNQFKIIVIDSNSLVRDVGCEMRDAGEKPASTFSHPAQANAAIPIHFS
jgi:hypothetical protein